MTMNHVRIATALVAAVLAASRPSKAASDCLSIALNAPATMCAGQTVLVSASVTNSCANRINATAQFAIGDQSLPVKAGFVVPGDSTRTKSLMWPVPASAPTGSSTLTVTVTDSAGDTTSQTIDVSVSSCTGAASVTNILGGRQPRQ